MVLFLPQKDYGQPLFNAPTRYRRNQAIRFYIGAKVQQPPKSTKKGKKPKTAQAAGATTIQFPFINRPLTIKHHFDHKQTYIETELKSLIETINLILDTLPLLPESLQDRPIVLFSNSRFVLNGITRFLPKWKANKWKSIRYTKEQQRQKELQDEYSTRWPHQKILVEEYYRSPLEGIIAHVDLWQEIDRLLAKLHALSNKVHFRKLNRKKHLRFRRRTLRSAAQAIKETTMALKWTSFKKRYRNLTLEEKEISKEEDALVLKQSHINIIRRHLTHYLKSRHGEIYDFQAIIEGSIPSMTTNQEPSRLFTSRGSSAHLTTSGLSLSGVSAGTNKLPARITSPVDEAAYYPIKMISNPTSITTLLSVDTLHDDGIDNGIEKTSIGDDDSFVGDFKVPIGKQINRSRETSTKRGFSGDGGKCPPFATSHLVAANYGADEVP